MTLANPTPEASETAEDGGSAGANEIVSQRLRCTMLVLLGTPIVGAYCYLNVAPVFTPITLPMTAVDTATPFLIWTVWPYAALDISNAVLPFFIRRRANFWQMILTMGIAMSVCIAFWALMPTTFPRPPVPMGDSASEHLYRFFLAIDQPLNCFPSGHIAAPGVLLVFAAREHPRVARLLWIIFGVAALSVLTTKQHYLWDALASIALVWLSVMLSGRILSRRARTGGAR